MIKSTTVFTATNASHRFIELVEPLIKENKYFTMRDCQKEVYDGYRHEQYVRVVVPPGGGKSMTIKYCHIKRLIEDGWNMLITVPQKMIAGSFGNDFLKMPNGQELDWYISHYNDLTDDTKTAMNTNSKEIAKFVNSRKRKKGMSGKVMVCCIPSLVKAFNEHRLSFKNTIIIIDEAHHIQDGGTEFSRNGLGKVVASILDRDNPDTKLWLLTATNHRGDGASIVDEKHEDKFKTYFLSMEKYFQTLKYIKSYSYEYFPYLGGDPTEVIKSILKIKKNRKKIILYVPGKGRKWMGQNKKAIVRNLIKNILSVWADANIIDLVSTSGNERKEQKAYLMDNKHNSDIDIVIAVSMLDEGVDWPEAEMVIDANHLDSFRINVQRFGRPLRDAPHKEHIKYCLLFPYSVTTDNMESCSDALNRYTTAMAMIMSVRENMFPTRIPTNIAVAIGGGEGGGREPKVNYFEDAVPDGGKRQAIAADALKEIAQQIIIAEADGKILVSKDYEECIEKVLEKHNVTENVELITAEIKVAFYNTVVPNVAQLDEELIDMLTKEWAEGHWKDISAFAKRFVSGRITSKMLKQLKEIFEGQRKPKEYWLEVAEKLVADSKNGMLPSATWLLENCLNPLNQCMFAHPELFAHLPQEKRMMTKEQRVAEAEQMAKESKDGILPCAYWLSKNGHRGLARSMEIYPELFAHIPQEDKKGKTKADHLNDAERLYKEKGILPNTAWLKKNGYENLVQCMILNKELFIHIPQEKLSKSPAEHVKTLEDACKNRYNGKLPSTSKMRDDGYRAEVGCKMKNQKLFAHIPQEIYEVKTPKEWVVEAKKLTKQNKDGAMPKNNWLVNNGYVGLVICMRKHLHLFKGMKRYYGRNNQIRIIGE